jgi:hypothetical protein
MWQDYVIATALVAFTLTTIPMIRSRVRLPLATTLTMVVGAAALALTYVTLGLWLSVAVETVALLGWAILLVRTFKRV